MSSLQQGTRVALDTTTKMIMQSLPPKVDPSVSAMMEETTEQIKWSDIGGLNDQIREIREVSRLSLIFIYYRSSSFLWFAPNSSFERVSRLPRAFFSTVLLEPGKRWLRRHWRRLSKRRLSKRWLLRWSRSMSENQAESFENSSVRLFLASYLDYARQHTPAVVFIDEIDAIGSKRRENVPIFGIP